MATAVLLSPHLRLGYYNIRDAARFVDKKLDTFHHSIKRGRIPRPSHRIPGGRQFYYTEEELMAVRERFAQPRSYKRHDE
jgi:hypothetical protein